MLSLKLATVEDVGAIVALLKNLHSNSVYAGIVPFVEADAVEKVMGVVDKVSENGVIVLLNEGTKSVGLVGASYISHMFNKQHKTAVELAFWIEPDFRTRSAIKQLLGAYRYWAKRVGCHSILMGKLKNRNEVETYNIRKL